MSPFAIPLSIISAITIDAIIPNFAEILVDDKSSNHVKEIRFNGLKRLQSQIEFYKSRGFVDFLLYNIAQKKGKMIMETTPQTFCNRKNKIKYKNKNKEPDQSTEIKLSPRADKIYKRIQV